MKKLAKWSVLALVAFGITLFWFLDSRVSSLPDLQIWHTVDLKEEFTARDVDEEYWLEDYLIQENELFAAMEEGFEGSYAPDPTMEVSRFEPGGFNNPQTFPQNWNRTFELMPDQIRGGALLLHGFCPSVL